MNKKIFWLSLVAVLLAFAGGFLLASALNRKELSALRAENESLKRAPDEANQADEEGNLSDDEIRQRIAEADGNPTNIPFQKNLGLALYNYASMKQNSELLGEVSRLITRVYEKNPADYEAVVTLGNINFDRGYFDKNNEKLQTAREFYQKALALKPDDADVMTDVGLTYYLSNPPENERAIAAFEKSFETNPNNEKTLQILIEVLTAQNKRAEAEKYIAKLKEVNPKNQILLTPESSGETTETDLQKQ